MLLALSVERLFLRLRMKELSTELRHLTASALAVVQEALESPVALPRDYGSGPVFPTPFPAPHILRVGCASCSRHGSCRSPRRWSPGARIGRSRRELHLSPETVKGYVARVLRKLGASNRVDAVSRYLRLTGAEER